MRARYRCGDGRRRRGRARERSILREIWWLFLGCFLLGIAFWISTEYLPVTLP